LTGALGRTIGRLTLPLINLSTTSSTTSKRSKLGGHLTVDLRGSLKLLRPTA
jgi:hypothetical protein